MNVGARRVAANVPSEIYRPQYVLLQLSARTGSRSIFAKVLEFILNSRARKMARSRRARARSHSSSQCMAMAERCRAKTLNPLGGKVGKSRLFRAVSFSSEEETSEA